jgi:hypothetical protein
VDQKTGSLLLGADSAEIAAGEVYGAVVLLWGELHVHGEVEEVLVLSGKVVFHPTARLKKSLVVMGGSFESRPGAQVAPQDVVYRAPGPLWRALRSVGNLWRDHFDWAAKVLGAVVLCLALWAFGCLLFLALPGLQAATAGRLGKEWPENLLVGWVGTLLAPVFLALLFLSVIGIVLVPLYFLTLLVLAVISYLAAALWAGHRLLPPKPGRRLNAGGFLLGIMAFQLLWASWTWWAWLPVIVLWSLAWGGLLRGARKLWR